MRFRFEGLAWYFNILVQGLGLNVGFGLQMGVVLELNQPERNNKKGSY